MSPPDMPRGLCVSLHDVSPGTWPQCQRILSKLDERARVPVTLLVIPWHRRECRLKHEPEFLKALDRRLARGDEIALHGLTHQDETPVGGSLRQYALRRLYTAGEGEFSALTRAQAQARLTQGLDQLLEVGWIPEGFVAPAWMLSEGACEALEDMPFRYTTTLGAFFTLPGWRRLNAPSLVWSVRSGLRRKISLAWNARLYRRSRRMPLLRLSLHPADAEHPRVLEQALCFIESALAERHAYTKRAWASRC